MSGATPIRGILFDKDGTLLDYPASQAALALRADIATPEQVSFG